jgi:2-dehydro-3-deoxygalactonokinase
MSQPDWIAVDWGTSRLRAFAVGPGGELLDEAISGAGMGRLAGAPAFEGALVALVEPWLADGEATEIVACGMVGARQGWIEAPYAEVPCPPGGRGAIRAPTSDARLSVHIVPGLCQRRPPDVMRGEETQIAGLLGREPAFEGTVCLPGTHTKWVHVSAGEVVSFTSFMTGELFNLLAGQSVLRHGLAGEGWSEADFAEAVEDSLARPERLAARLFGLRAGALLEGLPPERARARLSGFLIGAELAASRPHWLGREVVLIGAPAVAGPYRAALALCGLEARTADATELTLAGLAAARGAVREGASS